MEAGIFDLETLHRGGLAGQHLLPVGRAGLRTNISRTVGIYPLRKIVPVRPHSHLFVGPAPSGLHLKRITVISAGRVAAGRNCKTDYVRIAQRVDVYQPASGLLIVDHHRIGDVGCRGARCVKPGPEAAKERGTQRRRAGGFVENSQLQVHRFHNLRGAH